MQSEHDKTKAINIIWNAGPFDGYYVNNHKEKGSVEAVWYLGEAYHANYEFDKAIEQYTEYKEVLTKEIQRPWRQSTEIFIEQKCKTDVREPGACKLISLGENLNTEYLNTDH